MRSRDLQAAASVALLLLGVTTQQASAQTTTTNGGSGQTTTGTAPGGANNGAATPGTTSTGQTLPPGTTAPGQTPPGTTVPGSGTPGSVSGATGSGPTGSGTLTPALGGGQTTANPAQVGPTQTSPTTPSPAQAVANDTTGQPGLPQAPQPKLTEPLYLRDTNKDYAKPKKYFQFSDPLAPYTATNVPLPRLTNTQRVNALLQDGKINLSLADAVALALENNYDIAIARINLDIADTDILRTRSGQLPRGVSTGLITGTIGGSTSTITGGGGPGGTTVGSGGGGTGTAGIVSSTSGGGPQPYNFDPVLTGNLQYEAANAQQTTTFITGTNSLGQDTSTYNFGYVQGFITGTQLSVTFNNTRQTTNSQRSTYSPLLQSTWRAQATQHLLQGFGPGINGRFILQAKNDRRITDSSFRQQVIYTVSQVETIYWGLVSAYENEQAKERALAQSTQLAADNRKQLEIGTLAPLDVVNSDATVASDKQALIAAQSTLEYQQLIIKQAIARNLNDPQLANAPVIPTDRVDLSRVPEEDMSVEDLVKEAYTDSPSIEQQVISLKNNEITIRGEKNGLLPVIDGYAFYGGSAVGGAQNPNENCSTSATGPVVPCTGTNAAPSVGYNTVFGHLFNNSSPDKGVGVNITIPIRNRAAQADQARSQMEYRQNQMLLQQLYIRTRINVINAQYALTNDRASVQSAQAAQQFAAQSLDAEQKKYRLGASTTANVLQQERNLAGAENNLISATAAYALDRVSLNQILANTLDRYGISLVDTAEGVVKQTPRIPGLTAPKPPQPPKPISANPAPLQ